MKNFTNTLNEVSDIIQEYETSISPSITELMLWKRLLFGKWYYLVEQEKKEEVNYGKVFITAKGLKQENDKYYTDKMAEAYSNSFCPEYNLLHNINKVIQNACISIQQDIKILHQESINSKYDGQT